MLTRHLVALAALANPVRALAAPLPSRAASTTARTMTAATTNSYAATCVANPLLSEWKTPFQLPPFSEIAAHDFESALEAGMAAHKAELTVIAESPDPPSVADIEAYDRAGGLLRRVSAVFSNLCSSASSEELQVVQKAMAEPLSRHRSSVYQTPGLFPRINNVYEQRESLDLSNEQRRLVERVHLDFCRAGAGLSEEEQKELADLQARLAQLATEFQQNVMKDEETYELVLGLEDLSGCPQSLVQAARSAAEERGKEADQYVITLSRSLVEPFLTFADRRDLREQAWKAWVSRGELSPQRDNLSIAVDTLRLRQRVAQIHGYRSFAEYQCADRMAKTPEAVQELLENVWERAKEAANRERMAMEDFVSKCGMELEGGIQPYDWRYIAEKARKADYDFDESLLKPYLSLESVRGALFAVSSRLFGLEYRKRTDIPIYHPDVDAYEVRDKSSDRLVSIFLHDNFARSFKTSGAWMSELRSQTRNLAETDDTILGVPIVLNNNNFAKSHPTLLSYNDAHTLFHEFGHAHHGMLSNAFYRRLASTNVLTDFVELPSQLFEHWFDQRAILKEFAKHYETGEPLPDEMLDKLEAARSFQQGFQTIEYTACALLDMALHQINDFDGFDMNAFEKSELERLGMPAGIVMRHRPAHFQHLFSTSMYAAGYYVYLWAEVLDADAFAAFEEAGDVFDSETAAKAREFIYGAGNTLPPDELFRKFRGRDPQIDFMLKKKGLTGATA